VHATGVGYDIGRVQRNPAHLQCAIESPE
jgi:hypothetical protein